MKKVALNVKNMKEQYVNNSGCQYELENIWNTFHHMATMGFITSDEWKRFFETCKGWYIDEENAQVRDMNNNDKVIWTYNPETMYIA